MAHASQKLHLPMRAADTLTLVILLTLISVANPAAQAQTFTVLHNFTGGADGGSPYAGLTRNGASNFYGTTAVGGSDGNGTVFELRHAGSGWVLTPLYSFQGMPDGSTPQAQVTIGPNGSLYGTTTQGGEYAQGTVFNLTPASRPPAKVFDSWTETLLHSFSGAENDGAFPGSDVVFDSAGNIYGTTTFGGIYNSGTAYELTPSSGSVRVLYNYNCGEEITFSADLIFDRLGNLYGTFGYCGPYGYGEVYKLTPSGSGWTTSILYAFQGGNDGANPVAGLVSDASGNLYGNTITGGAGGGGTVYELSNAGLNWTFSVLYGIVGRFDSGSDNGSLVMDSDGNLYGTTVSGGLYGRGSVFKLTQHADGSWTFTDIYDFSGLLDGGGPNGGLILDEAGNLYGTTDSGGSSERGVVFEITP